MADLHDMEINAFLGQAEQLARLFEHPAWEGWTNLLTAMRQGMLEELVRCKPEDVRYWQGAAGALGEILDRPRRIVAEADAFRANEEEEKRGIRADLRAIVGAGVDQDGDV